MQVQPLVLFGCRLAPVVLGPVPRSGRQVHPRAVDRANGHLEAKRWFTILARPKAGRLLLQMGQYPPEKLFRHLHWLLPVGVRKSTATRRRRPANRRQRPALQLQAIAQIAQPDTVRQLNVQQTHGVAPGTAGA